MRLSGSLISFFIKISTEYRPVWAACIAYTSPVTCSTMKCINANKYVKYDVITYEMLTIIYYYQYKFFL